MMKRFVAIFAVLFAMASAALAEVKTESFPLDLKDNERIIGLYANPYLYTAVLEVKVKGVVQRTEYWIVTNTGRIGPFTTVPVTSAQISSTVRSFFAIFDGYLMYGPNLPGTSMGTVAKLEGSVEEIKISPDGSRWAALVESKQKAEAYDIVTDKGIFDWFSKPELVGFLSDNTLLYWTRTKTDKGHTFTFWRDKSKVGTYFTQFTYLQNSPAAFVSSDGKRWGWIEHPDVKNPGDEESKLHVRYAGGEKTMKCLLFSEILYIAPDGQVLVRNGISLFVDGIDSGIREVSGIEAISPDESRVALKIHDKYLLDGAIIKGGKTGWFSADSKHFVVENNFYYSFITASIDGEKVQVPDEASLKKVFGKDAELFGVGATNHTTLNSIVLVLGRDNTRSPSIDHLVGYLTGDIFVKLYAPFDSPNARVSDDGKTVVVTNGKQLFINGEVRYTSSVDRLDEFLLSPDGTEIFVYGHGIFTEDQLCPGRFFGKDLARAAPEGSVKYKDGVVVVTTW